MATTQPPARAQVFELFPTPLLRVQGVIAPVQAAALCAHFAAVASTPNPRSQVLTHTEILSPDAEPLLGPLVQALQPHLVAFGELLFGEKLAWNIKEMWVNALQTGGRQSVHNHANCFISGVLYLTDSDPSAQTVFIRSLGGHHFVFSNSNSRSSTGPFNAERWIGPAPSPGDLVLFPSYLLHEVPTNQGGQRVTLALNAIPHRLDSWGYAVSLAP